MAWLSKRQFCARNNIESQAFTRFVELGLLATELVLHKNGCTRTYIEDKEINRLING